MKSGTDLVNEAFDTHVEDTSKDVIERAEQTLSASPRRNTLTCEKKMRGPLDRPLESAQPLDGMPAWQTPGQHVSGRGTLIMFRAR